MNLLRPVFTSQYNDKLQDHLGIPHVHQCQNQKCRSETTEILIHYKDGIDMDEIEENYLRFCGSAITDRIKKNLKKQGPNQGQGPSPVSRYLAEFWHRIVTRKLINKDLRLQQCRVIKGILKESLEKDMHTDETGEKTSSDSSSCANLLELVDSSNLCNRDIWQILKVLMEKSIFIDEVLLWCLWYERSTAVQDENAQSEVFWCDAACWFQNEPDAGYFVSTVLAHAAHLLAQDRAWVIVLDYLSSNASNVRLVHHWFVQ